MGRPSTRTTSRSGSAVAPWVVTAWPLTVTRPSAISRSLARREASPASARILLSRFSTDGDGRWLALEGRRRLGQGPLRARPHPEPPADLDDLEPALLGLVARLQILDERAGLGRAPEVQHLLDPPDLDRGVGREEEGLDDVNGLGHWSPPSRSARSRSPRTADEERL